MKISRSFSDSAGYFRSLLTGALGNVTLSNMGFTSYQTRDGIRTVTMNLTNIQVLNSTINASSQSTNVLISTPNWVNITMTSFNGLIRFNFSEIGIGINIQGQGFLSFIANTTIFTLLSTGSDGNPIMALQNVTYNVTSSSFRNLTQLNAPVAATVQTNLLAYLNTKSYTFFMQAFQNRITTYINSANNYRLISGTKVYIDLRWVGGPTINYNASLGCSQNSITSWFNGTVTNKNNGSYVVPGIVLPVEMPNRFVTTTPVGSSQIMVSEYLIESYYYGLLQATPHVFLDSLPVGFPKILSTDSGYFPELNKAYPSSPVNLNISFPVLPNISIIPNYGLLGRIAVNVQTLVYNVNQWIYPLTFSLTIEYSVSLYFETNMIKAYSYRPLVKSVSILDSTIGTVNPYYLSQLGINLFKNFNMENGGIYFFPQFRLPYPSNSVFNNLRIRPQAGYIVVDYDVSIPDPVSGILNDDYC